MNNFFSKSMITLAAAAVALYGCAGTNDSSTTANDNGTSTTDTTHVMVTETDVTVYDIPDKDASLVMIETEVVSDTAGVMPATDNMANTTAGANLDYDNMFEDIDNTERYGILELARMNPNLSTFVQLLEQSGLASSLEVAGPVTLFAPTNQAFEALSKERYDSLTNLQDQALLTELINMHILPSEVSTAQFNSRQFIDREGDDIAINTEADGTVVYVGGAQIVKSDVKAANGILHVIDGIIETSPDAGVGPGLD